jgi:uracil phosphoribosyltransferase
MVEHPIARDCLTRMRDFRTAPREFYNLLSQLSYFLAQAATQDLTVKYQPVATPLATEDFPTLNEELAIVPVLRAGLGIMEGFRFFCPEAVIGYIGVSRDEQTLKPACYLKKLPKLAGRRVFVLDPMLATGGSAAMAVDAVRGAGAARVILVTIISAPEGVELMQKRFPDVPIYTIALDRCLDDKGFIVPGLGDAGDRMHGTVEPPA